jgi:hypothetical protein
MNQEIKFLVGPKVKKKYKSLEMWEKKFIKKKVIEQINRLSKQEDILHFLGKKSYINDKEFNKICDILEEQEIILKFLTFYNFERVGKYFKKKQEQY